MLMVTVIEVPIVSQNHYVDHIGEYENRIWFPKKMREIECLYKSPLTACPLL